MFNALLITKNPEWVEVIERIGEKGNIEVAATSEWKRTFGDKSNYHYYFIDVDSVESPQELQLGSSAILIGLTKTADFERTRTWLVAGAKDLIVFPEETKRLEAILEETKEQIKFQRETDIGVGSGEVHVLYSAKGGSGKTLLSAMMAQSLSVHHGKNVLLIDLNAQFGLVDTIFGIQRFRSYYDLLPVLDELDIRHIDNVSVTDEQTNVTILPGPSSPAKAEGVTDELINSLIRVARYRYDFILLDVPSSINNVTFSALNQASHIHYILTPDSLGVRAYKYAEDLFERFQIGRGDRMSLLLNRIHPKSELTVKDMEKVIGNEVQGTIRSDYFTVQPHVNMGDSFYKKKKDTGTSKVAKDMKKYVETYVKQPVKG